MYPTRLTDEQWALLEPLIGTADKRGRFSENIRRVVDGILYVSHTGCR